MPFLKENKFYVALNEIDAFNEIKRPVKCLSLLEILHARLRAFLNETSRFLKRLLIIQVNRTFYNEMEGRGHTCMSQSIIISNLLISNKY